MINLRLNLAEWLIVFAATRIMPEHPHTDIWGKHLLAVQEEILNDMKANTP